MKERLKYYLRGLGTGIVVTMILMMVSNANAAQDTGNNNIEIQQEEQSLEESEDVETIESIPLIERESAVTPVTEQYVEESGEQTESEAVTEEATAEFFSGTEASNEIADSKETDATNIEESTSKPEEGVAVEESASVVENAEDAGQKTVDAAITIQVVKGDGSGTVARKLKNAGLIDNASEFDAYLMQHGYDKKIRIGTVKIEAGSTWMEIANKLIGK